MKLVFAVVAGGALGVFAGIMLLPDLAFLTMIIGAVIGAVLGSRGRKVEYSDGPWEDGSEG